MEIMTGFWIGFLTGSACVAVPILILLGALFFKYQVEWEWVKE